MLLPWGYLNKAIIGAIFKAIFSLYLAKYRVFVSVLELLETIGKSGS